MKTMYETKISDLRWYIYDIPGNIGWLAYLVAVILAFVKHTDFWAINIVSLAPAVCMLVGIGELVGERIAKLDRILPLGRLLMGFGALTLGGLCGLVVGIVAMALNFNAVYLVMTLSGALCFVFAGLLLMGYKKK